MNVISVDDVRGIVKEARETMNSYVRPGVGSLQCTKLYDATAHKYDDYITALGSVGVRKTAEAMGAMLPEKTQRATVRILDIGAGTGRVGEELQKMGFRHMDALDPSQGMLNVARTRGVYTNFFCNYINDTQLPIESNTYDGITICGAMGDNHIPCCALHEMIRLVKPGGYIVNVTRLGLVEECSDYRGRLDPLMEQLENEGKWRQISRTTFPNMHSGKEGLLLVHQVL